MNVLRSILVFLLLVGSVAPVGTQVGFVDSPDKINSQMVHPFDAQNVDYIGHTGGSVASVAVQGNYAYIGEGSSLTVLDITNVELPIVVGRTGLLPGLVQHVAVAGDYVYLTTGIETSPGEFIIIDISNPTRPFEVGSCACGLFHPTNDVAVVGDYAYIVSSTCYEFGCEGDLRVIDVSDPLNPYLAGFYSTYALAIAVTGSFAYLGGEGLRVIDISDPAHPVEVGFLPRPETDVSVAVSGSFAYLVANFRMHVIDISEPGNLIEVGFFETNIFLHDVAVAGDYAYLAFEDQGLGGLRVVDISDPADPFEVGSYGTQIGSQAVEIEGSFAFLSGGKNVSVIDVSVPSNPGEVGAYASPGPAFALSVVVADDYAFVADPDPNSWEMNSALRVIDVSDPANLNDAGAIDIPGNVHDVAVGGNYAYLTGGAKGYFDDTPDGLRVLDISDPTHPLDVGFIETPDYVVGVAVAGDYAYLAAGESGMQVIDVSDPANPGQVSSLDTPGRAYELAISGGYVYLADRDGGLRVIDVHDPIHPNEVSTCPTPGAAGGVAIAGSYAYVTDWSYGLRIIDISDPFNPFETGTFNTPYGSARVAVAGDFAFLADYSRGLRVIDVSDPVNPSEVGYFDTPYDSIDVVTEGSFALVADEHAGLIILKYTGVKDASLTTILSDRPDPSFVGDSFTVRVEVGTDFGVPSGVANVSVEGHAATCKVVLVGGRGSCQLALDAVGTYTLTAAYSGDKYFMPSKAMARHTVVKPTWYYLPMVGCK